MAARAHCSLALSLLCIFLCSPAGGGAREQLPSALVVGTVFCDTCFHQELAESSYFISGASVAVECGDAANQLGYRKVATTDRRGVFGVRLPPRISRNLGLVETCSVKLLRSNEPFCAVAASATTAGLRLQSRRNGVHVYSAGFFSFKPLNPPDLCHQKPQLDQAAFFLPSPPSFGGVPVPANPLFPPPSLLPPNPLFPPPFLLPPNPLFPPPSLLPPNPLFPPPSLLPPNPLFPPPSLLPPNPLQPPPSVLPPFPLQPPPAPSFNLPPVPLLTPPPPPPPVLPFPPVPFVPVPRFPGVPPASSWKKTSP